MNLVLFKKSRQTISSFINFIGLRNGFWTHSKSFGIFISHAWEYGMEYILLLELLYSVNDFEWHNCSTPKFELVKDSGLDLVNEYLPGLLKKQISAANCVLIISDMYVKNSYWIKKQIDFAKELDKPIIAVKSRSLIRLHDDIKTAASMTAEWNAQSVVQAVRNCVS